MKVVATARYGVAIGLLYCLALTGLTAGAEEPPVKDSDKAPPVKQGEAPKPSDSKSIEPKAPETKPPAQVTPKPSETKPSEATKTPEPKSAPAKPAEQKESPKPEKAPDSKPVDAKGTTTPAPTVTKPTEAKSAEPSKPPLTPIISVKLALMSDPRLFPYEVNVDMNGEAAILSGKVGSEAEKAAATEIAQSIEGVKSVTNNLEIVKDLPQTLLRKKDEAITQYVKDRFAKSKTLESAHFDVKTEDGVVLLSGKTKFLVIALEAAEAARQVPGVKAVKSEGIRVEGPE